MICEDEVRDLLCVQDFMRNPHSTHRNFYSDCGNAMLAESAAIRDSITIIAVFTMEPRGDHVSFKGGGWSLRRVNQAVDRRRVVKNSQEQWYAVGGIRPSSEDSASRSGVRISTVVEHGRVEYVPVSPSVPLAPAICRFPQESPRRGKLRQSGKIKKLLRFFYVTGSWNFWNVHVRLPWNTLVQLQN